MQTCITNRKADFMVTVISKSKVYGWKAKTTFDLGNNQILVLSTSKRGDGRISTHASVSLDNGNGSTTHAIFADYSKNIRVTDSKVIANEKAITNFHHESLLKIEEIKQAVQKYYQIPLTNGIRLTA